jgi:TPR repeat protein
MADVAHEASGPASPKPGDIAPQQASRPASPDSKLRVFISYSREDLEFADQLDAALDACGFESVLDRQGISGGEDWKRRLGTLVSEADTVVFVLSPTSARSEICAWEVEEATRLGKRILPVNCRPLEGVSPPPQLRERNYIFFHADPKAAPGSGFGSGLAKLIAALNTDFDWLREHTRYLQRATEWDRGGRPANRLLSGDDIAEAKAWAGRRPKNAPEPTALHLDFLRASEEEAEARSSAQRKQLEAMAAAQAERQTALDQAQEAQRKRATMARIRNIALVAVSILAVIAVLLFLQSEQRRITANELRHIAEEQRAVAEKQREVAEKQREQADDLLVGASRIITKLQDHMDNNTIEEVFAVFRTGADRGNAGAMGNLGLAYQHGRGVAQDYAKAREWYEKAADKGDAVAMTYLGELYEKGLGVAQDHARARELYEKAVEKSQQSALPEGQRLLGEGLGMLSLGLLHHEAQDYAKAHEWWEKSADKGDARAMANLGVLYSLGHGVTQDYVRAREWYEKAADKGNANAMANLGLFYESGEGVAQDYAKAREWYEKGADKGDALAMGYLGMLYANGHGVTQDYATARKWYEKAADKADKTAMTNLGVLYANGHGVARDYVKAHEWYEKAAEKGSARAMAEIGLLYVNGAGVAQDYAKAREWYEKAADKGEALGMFRLGRLYHLTQDYAKAREWYEKAADKGDTRGIADLEKLAVSEAAGAGRYAEALKLQEALAVKVEEAETTREGKPGKGTAEALYGVAWHALFAREFMKAFTAANRVHAILPDDRTFEVNRAHALMFLKRGKEAKALYLAHKGKPMSEEDASLWEHVIAEDFAEFRKAGLTRPLMAEIEKELGVSR